MEENIKDGKKRLSDEEYKDAIKKLIKYRNVVVEQINDEEEFDKTFKAFQMAIFALSRERRNPIWFTPLNNLTLSETSEEYDEIFKIMDDMSDNKDTSTNIKRIDHEERKKSLPGYILIETAAKKGTSLYSPAYGDILLDYVDEPVPYMKKTPMIHCYSKSGNKKTFFMDGTLSTHGEVMLFPSNENRDWSSFKVEHTIDFSDVEKNFLLHGNKVLSVISTKYGVTEYDDSLINKLHMLILARDMYNGIWKAEWNIGYQQNKYAILRTTKGEDETIGVMAVVNNLLQPPIFTFKDKETAEKFLSVFKNDILYVFRELDI